MSEVMTAYYNENDKFAAAWLRELISAGCIAPGIVDDRSILDVKPKELDGFKQCHFFAGIGAWSYALRQAGWPDDRPVWTGSCPCQPFSTAGNGSGFNDERHLWPAWFHLISERRPAIIFGEQVGSRRAWPWIDLVQADVEALDYAFGCVPFPAAGVGAPHIRDRCYWVARTADANCTRPQRADEHGFNGAQEITRAWSSIAGIHAERNWESWLSESGTPALIDGAPARVGRMRGYGNAINTEAAKTFIECIYEDPFNPYYIR